jgi:hypothetical protein
VKPHHPNNATLEEPHPIGGSTRMIYKVYSLEETSSLLQELYVTPDPYVLADPIKADEGASQEYNSLA